MDERLELVLKGNDFKRLIETQFDQIKQKYNLKKVEIEVLFFLYSSGEENTPTDITKHLHLNRGHVSQAVDALLRHGYVDAATDKLDRRCTHYTVTDNAIQVIEEIGAVKRDMDERILEGITKEELELYKTISEKMLQNIRKIIS